MKKIETEKFVVSLKKILKNKINIHQNVKCDCTHVQKNHYNNEGWCKKCGCTWFYPNIEYVKRKKEISK